VLAHSLLLEGEKINRSSIFKQQKKNIKYCSIKGTADIAGWKIHQYKDTSQGKQTRGDARAETSFGCKPGVIEPCPSRNADVGKSVTRIPKVTT